MPSPFPQAPALSEEALTHARRDVVDASASSSAPVIKREDEHPFGEFVLYEASSSQPFHTSIIQGNSIGLYDPSHPPWRTAYDEHGDDAVSPISDPGVHQRQERSEEEPKVQSASASPQRVTSGSLVQRRRRKSHHTHHGRKMSAPEIREAQENQIMLMAQRQQQAIMLAGPPFGGPLTIWRDGTDAKRVDSTAP
ncbi:hypothetical protein FRB96_009343 [Tulasnella sp. 330]|nr:hypothetical protein FRB96_009343 [Tulasnella sp. 330]KAG8884419.1 hypothetical protein FRB98_002391 [Tulasnella sp. 332]KAG8885255.1 hypothetical protein FRB97_001701 [Tulasnella sp. 331]